MFPLAAPHFSLSGGRCAADFANVEHHFFFAEFSFGSDGAWQEGRGYWAYATAETVRFIDALKRVSGDRVNLYRHPAYQLVWSGLSETFTARERRGFDAGELQSEVSALSVAIQPRPAPKPARRRR